MTYLTSNISLKDAFFSSPSLKRDVSVGIFILEDDIETKVNLSHEIITKKLSNIINPLEDTSSLADSLRKICA